MRDFVRRFAQAVKWMWCKLFAEDKVKLAKERWIWWQERWRCPTPWSLSKTQKCTWKCYMWIWDLHTFWLLVLVRLKSEASSFQMVLFVQHGDFNSQWLKDQVWVVAKSVEEGWGCKGLLKSFQRIMQWSGVLAVDIGSSAMICEYRW